MSKRTLCLRLAALAAVAFSFETGADVYKCIDADNAVTFSQTPCPNQVTTTVATRSSVRQGAAIDCTHASQFAVIVSEAMKRGMGSADVFNQYGGMSALSKNAINVINYVYMFKHSDDLSAARIAGLAAGKCKARAFGNIKCEVMPAAYVDQIGGCDAKPPDAPEGGPAAAEDLDASRFSAASTQVVQTGESTTRDQRAQARRSELRSVEARNACGDRAQSEIDSINARMRSGYTSSQGEQFRQRLRALRQQIRDCRLAGD